MSKTPIDGLQYVVGVAYVAIPFDLSRSKYINYCYMTNTVSLRTEDGGFINRVPVSPEVMGFLTFPEKLEEVGSQVLYMSEYNSNQLYVIGRVQSQDSLGTLQEGQFKFGRKVDKTFVEITGSAKSKFLGITLNTQEEGGEIYLNVISKSGGKLKIFVKGDIEVSSTETLRQTANKQVISECKDSTNTSTFTLLPSSTEIDSKTVDVKADLISLDTKALKVGKGNEPMVLGTQLTLLLTKLIAACSAITTSAGPILNIPQFTELLTELESLLSKQSTLE